MAVGLRKNGAAPGATTALWLGNPTLNPAVLVFILFTLGWPWVMLRLVLGVALVAAGAWLTMRLTASARGGGDVDAETLESLGAHVREAPPPGGSPARAWIRGVIRWAVRLTPEYLVMVGLLGAARAFLFTDGVLLTGDHPLALIGLAAAATLFVIPTAGEVPIVQTMLASGVGAGPAGILLLTLAPLSLPSMLMLGRVFPARVLAALAGLTVAAGLAAGLAARVLHL